MAALQTAQNKTSGHRGRSLEFLQVGAIRAGPKFTSSLRQER